MTRVPYGQCHVSYGWILGTRRRHAGAPSVTKTLSWGSYCKDAVFLNSVNVAFIALLIMSESVSL
jgi:hypothetical protein